MAPWNWPNNYIVTAREQSHGILTGACPCRKKMDTGYGARLERRLQELFKERMQTHEHRLDEWRLQQATRASLHAEQSDTVRA